MIVEPFPPPPVLVGHALAQLAIVRGRDAVAISKLGDVGKLPRPWQPAACSDQLRHHLWLWCDDVATWINEQYAWRSAHLIPECWPRHRHIAYELPSLACQRVIADEAAGPDLLEEWHRNTLPLFLERVASRLGESQCRTGRHVDWPAAARHEASRSGASIRARQDLFCADNPVTQLHPVGRT